MIPKIETWDGKDLIGTWHCSLKIDGVRANVKNGVVTSRNGKPLYGLEDYEDGDYEVFCDNWENSITATRSADFGPIDSKYVYSLYPLDSRLRGPMEVNPTKENIKGRLNVAVMSGYEGLVLRNGDRWIKVKPSETHDVVVLGFTTGKVGTRLENRLAALVTEMGKVSIQDDTVRKELENYPALIGSVVEVECMQLTKNGKFRHPRYKRLRVDK